MQVSPGRLTATWLIIRSLQKLGGKIHEKELLRFASRSGLRGGGLPTTEGFRIATSCNFIRIEGTEASFTPLGSIAAQLCQEDEPNTDVLRLFLSTIVLRSPPNWVAVWQGNPSLLDLALSDTDRQLLEAASLLPMPKPSDLAAWGWWRALSQVPVSEETNELRKAIGDAGEYISLKYEQARLRVEGFPDLAEQVRWVARESPAYGFDIASFAGKHPYLSPASPLAIEVKSISHRVESQFRFFYTRHEYETGRDLADTYILHLWEGVRIGNPPAAAHRTPRLLKLQEFQDHLPSSSECGDTGCRWEAARVFVEVACPFD